jgi:type VI secretion system protein ImpG
MNLFEQSVDPIRLDQKKVQHHIVPDGRNLGAYEIHTILEVESTSPGTTETKPYKPFYALRSGDTSADETAFWHAERQASMRKGDEGSDMFLTLVDPKGMPCALTDSGVLHITALCLNRDLAERLPYKDPGGDLRAAGKPDVAKIICLEKPTPALRPSLHGESRWKLVSSLALNHLSLTGTPERPEAGLEAFKEILGAHDFVNDEVTRQRMDGLVSMATRTVMRRLPGRGLARGLEITLEFDESKYVGSGVFLFASVLERFLAAYTSINSFTQCIARVRQREGDLKRWLPQFGEQAQL